MKTKIIFIGVFMAAATLLMTHSNLGEHLLNSVSNIEIFDIENQERLENDLKPLELNEQLSDAAQKKADDMASRGYFAHSSPEGIPFWYWILRLGYDFMYAGENLAVRFETSQGVVNAWMNSPTHEANILNTNFKDTGIGIATGEYKGEVTEYVIQLFGQEMPKFIMK